MTGKRAPLSDGALELLRAIADAPGGRRVPRTLSGASRVRALAARGYAVRGRGDVWTVTDAGRNALANKGKPHD